MRKWLTIALVLILVAAVALPWWAAYRSDQAMTYEYGKLGGKQISCVVVDGTHFDRYNALVFDHSAATRVYYDGHGGIVLDGRKVGFPTGKNVGWLRDDGSVQFASVNASEITASRSGSSEVYYILGRVPHMNKFPFGTPTTEFVLKNFLGGL